MEQISLDQLTPAIRSLFQPLDDHLITASILAGLTPAVLYVDNPQAPRAALAWFHGRLLLSGPPDDPRLCASLSELLTERIIPQMQGAGIEAFVLYPYPQEWAESSADLLPEIHSLSGLRQHYTCDRLAHHWQAVLPDGYTLLPVNADLLAEPGLRRQDELRAEMVSERPSLDDFLEKSFGVCAQYKDELVGWCLSEYNCAGRCEVGIATNEAHRRRGLGKAMTLALAQEAFNRGLHQVGWHCWANNVPSAALALSAGFRLQRQYPVRLFLLGDH